MCSSVSLSSLSLSVGGRAFVVRRPSPARFFFFFHHEEEEVGHDQGVEELWWQMYDDDKVRSKKKTRQLMKNNHDQKENFGKKVRAKTGLADLSASS